MSCLIVYSLYTLLPLGQFQATACFSTAFKRIAFIFFKGKKKKKKDTHKEEKQHRHMWPAKPKVFTIWTFIENICQSLYYEFQEMLFLSQRV